MAAYYTFEDYSGTSTPSKSDNPYDGLIEACSSDPVRTNLLSLSLSLSSLQELPRLPPYTMLTSTYSNASKPPTKPTDPTATPSKKPNSSPPTSPA
jgi:hypothetical protein